jgi:predicted RND superfamily exporter protein
MIKTKLIIILIAAFILMSVAFGITVKLLMNKSNENSRNKQNVIALNKDIKFEKAKNGQLIAKVYTLSVTTQQALDVIPSLKQDIKNINEKLRNVKYVTSAEITTTNNINTKVRDSVAFDTVHFLVDEYIDEWFYFYRVQQEGSTEAKVKYKSRDSLSIVGIEKKKGFLGLGKKERYVKITSKNPNSELTYSESVFFVKQRKEK